MYFIYIYFLYGSCPAKMLAWQQVTAAVNSIHDRNDRRDKRVCCFPRRWQCSPHPTTRVLHVFPFGFIFQDFRFGWVTLLFMEVERCVLLHMPHCEVFIFLMHLLLKFVKALHCFDALYDYPRACWLTIWSMLLKLVFNARLIKKNNSCLTLACLQLLHIS